jgi:hypothetical protein
MREATEDFTFPLKAFEDRIFNFLALMSDIQKRKMNVLPSKRFSCKKYDKLKKTI